MWQRMTVREARAQQDKGCLVFWRPNYSVGPFDDEDDAWIMLDRPLAEKKHHGD